MESVNIFKFLGVYISDDLPWAQHTDVITKKAQQCLIFFLIMFNLHVYRQQNNYILTSSSITGLLTNCYRYTVKSVLTGCIIARYMMQSVRIMP